MKANNVFGLSDVSNSSLENPRRIQVYPTARIYEQSTSSHLDQPFSSSGQAPAIRQGLSVQELKEITARRIAYSGDSNVNSSVSSTPKPGVFVNPAGTYQTATPRQLEAAGIPPIVLSSPNLSFSSGRYQPNREKEREIFENAGLAPPAGNVPVRRSDSMQMRPVDSRTRNDIPLSTTMFYERNPPYFSSPKTNIHDRDLHPADESYSFPDQRRHLGASNTAVNLTSVRPLDRPPAPADPLPRSRAGSESFVGRTSSLVKDSYPNEATIPRSTRQIMEPIHRPVDHEGLLRLDIFREGGPSERVRAAGIQDMPLPPSVPRDLDYVYSQMQRDKGREMKARDRSQSLMDDYPAAPRFPREREMGPFFSYGFSEQRDASPGGLHSQKAKASLERSSEALHPQQLSAGFMAPWEEEAGDEGTDEQIQPPAGDGRYASGDDRGQPIVIVDSFLRFAGSAKTNSLQGSRSQTALTSLPPSESSSSSAKEQKGNVQLPMLSPSEVKDKASPDVTSRPPRTVLRGNTQWLGIGSGTAAAATTTREKDREFTRSSSEAKLLPASSCPSPLPAVKAKAPIRLPPGLTPGDWTADSGSGKFNKGSFAEGSSASLSTSGSDKFGRRRQLTGRNVLSTDCSEDRSEETLAKEVAEFAISSPLNSSHHSSSKFQSFQPLHSPVMDRDRDRDRD